MITEMMLGGLVHLEKIQEMHKELTGVIGDFDRAVNVESLRISNETSKHKLLSNWR